MHGVGDKPCDGIDGPQVLMDEASPEIDDTAVAHDGIKTAHGCTWQEGFFRMARGRDECHVESLAVAVSVLP